MTNFCQAGYLKRHHKRSLAETAVSTAKRKLIIPFTQRRGEGRRKNELRLKVLTYNLSMIARLPVQFE